MKTFYFGFFGVFALVYLAYLTWLTGYRAGYDEGNTKGWATARKALAPQLDDPAELITVASEAAPGAENRSAIDLSR